MDLSHVSQGWVLTLMSSSLSVLGCLIIFLDNVYYFLLPRSFTKNHPFNLQQNYSFLIASLGFSSGCLLFTSLYRLLPTAGEYLRISRPDDQIAPELDRALTIDLVVSYLGGIVVCLSLNALLHLATSESVVHCDHDGDVESLVTSRSHLPVHDVHDHHHEHHHEHSHHHDHHEHSHEHHDHSHEHGDHEEMSEATPLLEPKRKFSLIHLFKAESSNTECKGYSSAEVCVNDNLKHALHYCELPTLSKDSDGESAHHVEDDELAHITPYKSNVSYHSEHHPHHHHVASPLSRLFTIGIQTTLAITLHKFPEGFITYVTSAADKKLGVSVFLSLLVHNFIEGFSMCLPLYFSFANSGSYPKLKAILISGGLGGVSQPLGALIGMVFLKYSPVSRGSDDLNGLNFIFGITIATTSGFLTVVALSMYGSAVSFNGGGSNSPLMWALFGIGVIGGSLVLTKDN